MLKCEKFDLSVYVIIDPLVCGDERIEDVTRAVLAGGATFLQLRNKVDSLAVVENQARRIMSLLKGVGIPFVLDDYAELAAALDMDGVHIGQDDMSVIKARTLIGEDKILGLTAFTSDHYKAVDPSLVDYLGTGPIYPTLTKPDKAVLGEEGFASLVADAPIPVVGIGGITPDNAGAVIRAGADGVAMIRSVIGAADVCGATRDFVEVVRLA